MYGQASPQPIVTTTSACPASSRVSSLGLRSDRSMPSSCMTAMTSGCTLSAGVVPADSETCRPAAARSKSAWLICERPALCRQTNRTVAIDGHSLGGFAWGINKRLGAAHELVGGHADGGAEHRPDHVDPKTAPSTRGQGRAEGARRVHRGSGYRATEQRIESHGPTDRDGGSGADRTSIGRNGGDHEHQEGRQ